MNRTIDHELDLIIPDASPEATRPAEEVCTLLVRSSRLDGCSWLDAGGFEG